MAEQRIWTIEELKRIHPLPEGWRWEWWGKGLGWTAARLNACGAPIERVGIKPIADGGGLDATDAGPPIDVCEAVILVSKGLDSLAAMMSVPPDLPTPNPRRPWDDTDAERARAGLPHYEESDRDYLANNNNLAVRLLDAYIRHGRAKP